MNKLFTKIGITAAILGALWVGSNFAMNQYWAQHYDGPTYYTKITETPENSASEKEHAVYEYDQKAYNKSGEEKTVHLSEYRDRPLRKGAYLKMVVNNDKGVTSWEEVEKSDLPKVVAEELN